MNIDNIEITGIADEAVRRRVTHQIRNVFLSRKRTIPGSRGFGLEGTFVDMPPLEATTRFALELDEAVSSALPQIRIRRVDPTYEKDGKVTFRVHVEWRE